MVEYIIRQDDLIGFNHPRNAHDKNVLLHAPLFTSLTLAQRATHSLLYVLPSEPHTGLYSFVQTHAPAVSMWFVFHGVSRAVCKYVK